jgi:hypothetical protein
LYIYVYVQVCVYVYCTVCKFEASNTVKKTGSMLVLINLIDLRCGYIAEILIR